MNCAATLHLHAGAFSKTLITLSSQQLCCTHTQTQRTADANDTVHLYSTSLPGNPPPVFSLCLFEGCNLVLSLLLRAQVTLPCWHKLGHEQSIMGTCSAWRPECAHFCSQAHCLPFCTPSGPGRTIALLRPRAAKWWKSNTCCPLPFQGQKEGYYVQTSS